MKDKQYLYGLIIVLIAGYALYYFFFRKGMNGAMFGSHGKTTGCGCNSSPNGAVCESSSPSGDIITTRTRILYDDPIVLEPGDHFMESEYDERNLTDITYGYNGLSENSPTNLAVPLMATPEMVRIAPFNQGGGEIKDY